MDFDVRDNHDGSYTVSTRSGDSDGGKAAVITCGIIAYVITIIGLLMATFEVTDIPYALIILIFLDILVISPIILLPFFLIKGKRVFSVFLAVPRFIGKYAYIPFFIMYTVLWILYFNNITGTIFSTIFFFSMYGMYYFPYYMLRTARKHDSRMMSIITLVAIYSGITAMTIVAVVYPQIGGYYAMVFPSTLALFSLVSVPISNLYYKKHRSKKSALKLSTFFIILGASIIAVAVILAGIISMQ